MAGLMVASCVDMDSWGSIGFSSGAANLGDSGVAISGGSGSSTETGANYPSIISISSQTIVLMN